MFLNLSQDSLTISAVTAAARIQRSAAGATNVHSASKELRDDCANTKDQDQDYNV